MENQLSYLVFVYFVYGLAFFSMGLAVWLEAGRTSGFQNIRMLRFLAGFGFLHGVHEWVEIFTILHNAGVIELANPFLTNVLDVTFLLLSFVLLFSFGAFMIFSERGGDGRIRTILVVLIFLAVWAISTAVALSIYKPCREGCMDVADVLGRYLLGIPGALLAAWAMLLQRRSFQARGMTRCATDIRWAALALVLYGVVGQIFTKQTPLFPSTIINTDLFLQWFGFPVQILRAVMAVLVAVFVIRALRAFELERRQRLTEAQRAALETQQRARTETEALNQELQTAVQNLTTLFDLSYNLARSLDRDTILRQTLPQICESMPHIARGVIFIHERGQRPLHPIICYPPNLPVNGSTGASLAPPILLVAEYVDTSGGPACWLDGAVQPLDPTEFKAGVNSPQRYGRVIGLPLLIKEQISGSLVLTLQKESEGATLNDLSMFCTISRQLSLAIENAALYQDVQAREELRGELLHRVVTAQEMERQRIARELHDGVGQMLTALGLGLAAARDSITRDPERSFQQLDELKSMGTQVLHELQDLVTGLRPSVLDDLGLLPALRGLVQQFDNRVETAVHLNVQGHSRRLQPEIETVLFRIAQEALTNAVRHAQAAHVNVALDFNTDFTELRIEDDGCGFDPEAILRTDHKQHWGLLGIEERVTLVGGRSQIHSSPGEGTIIAVNIPLQEELAHV
ncbi:MAG: GAF domain-containing sensor histidine kinase [Ardenticatenaceae bacterium]|nr:GAF domain-containing sensor histidine kinase [Ardenticatenaceae bacterium]MCB9445273.1 GAF domain-containing sensor histidine kinase [Ardenticatenaceae bacterium]